MSEPVKAGKNENKNGALQKFIPDGESADQRPQSSQSGIGGIGLRGAIL